jgi:hypothetical protein
MNDPIWGVRKSPEIGCSSMLSLIFYPEDEDSMFL